MVIAPSIVPTAPGVDVTVSVQLAVGATVLPQVVVSPKSPLATMLVIVNVFVVLVFFSVDVFAALVVPTACPRKESVVGVNVTVCARVICVTPNRHDKTILTRANFRDIDLLQCGLGWPGDFLRRDPTPTILKS